MYSNDEIDFYSGILKKYKNNKIKKKLEKAHKKIHCTSPRSLPGTLAIPTPRPTQGHCRISSIDRLKSQNHITDSRSGGKRVVFTHPWKLTYIKKRKRFSIIDRLRLFLFFSKFLGRLGVPTNKLFFSLSFCYYYFFSQGFVFNSFLL